MAIRPLPRRMLLAAALTGGAREASAEGAAWAVLRAGGLVLFRHAIAPGGGDPAGMRLGDCATERNLDEAGRAQARRIGASLRQAGVAVGAVLVSEWCRTRETAELAFPGQAQAEPAFNSFFGDRSVAEARTDAARDILLRWPGPGALVVVTHQVNITALTARLGAATVPASGEGVVLRLQDGRLVLAGRIQP